VRRVSFWSTKNFTLCMKPRFPNECVLPCLGWGPYPIRLVPFLRTFSLRFFGPYSLRKTYFFVSLFFTR
jgi:hypothetical protein